MSIIINHNHPPSALPNFCNLGINLRILVAVDLMSVAVAAVKATDTAGMWRELMDISTAVQPILLASLIALCLARPLLTKLSYPAGIATVIGLELLLAAAVHGLHRHFMGIADGAGLLRWWVFTSATVAVLLGYFHLRSKALSPALSEARLQALQARIRPHFLFNSLNAVLSLIRSDPKRAEQALEDMADLFRVLMADNRQLAPLAREIELCREYLDLEQLRLGERLQVAWHIDKMPHDALIPPLVLQPLLENAVYHGIEPSSTPGEVSINIYRNRNQVHCVLRNPYQRDGAHHTGNKMALQNIRERLALHFDAEASLDARLVGGAYQVHIVLPFVQEERRGQ